MYLTREELRQVDRVAVDRFGFSGLVLMENAGRGVVDAICALQPPGAVVVCCGKGNNAGDGYVIARHLKLRTIPVTVLQCVPPIGLDGDAAVNFALLEHCEIPVIQISVEHPEQQLIDPLQGADWIVDALLGTGACGAPRSPIAQVIDRLNDAGARRLAVDVPSGLDCDTGVPASPTFQADVTCTFVAEKKGFKNSQAIKVLGKVHVLDIGIPSSLVNRILNRSQ